MKFKEIGSAFCTMESNKDENDCNPNIPINAFQNIAYYSSCRDAIREVLEIEKKSSGVAIVPPFTCHAVLQPFIEKGMDVLPYYIDKNLKICTKKTLELVEQVKPVCFLYHPYFGFEEKEMTAIISKLKETGCLVIEDKTQTMFSNYTNAEPDYIVGSLRKWVEIPDGGFLSSQSLNVQEARDSFDALVELALSAMKMKCNYLINNIGDSSTYRNLFTQYEELLDNNENIYRMSRYAKNTLQNYKWEDFRNRRRDNYNALLDGLNTIKEIEIIYKSIDEETVPFMFPIYIWNGRKDLQSYLAANKIYATAIWACPEILEKRVSEEVHSIYDHILCLAIDQRYTEEDMKRVVLCIKDYYSKGKIV